MTSGLAPTRRVEVRSSTFGRYCYSCSLPGLCSAEWNNWSDHVKAAKAVLVRSTARLAFVA